MKIVFATWNPKKIIEIQRMTPEGVEILCLRDIPEAQGVPQAEETGTTFQENADIKAKFWAEKLGMTTIAEDSGIEIEALNGYPGVYTKRCIEKLRPGIELDVDSDNPDELYPTLLEIMAETGNKSTSAKWVSAMALCYFGKTKYHTISVKYSLKGNMCSRAGDRVFGFDQYFKPNGYDKTLSELAPEVKDSIGPRKEAFNRILSEMGKINFEKNS